MNNSISLIQVMGDFLPKIAREYNITREESAGSRRAQTNNTDCSYPVPVISTGLFSSFFSNNHINLSSPQESSRNLEKKEEERPSPNYLQWIIVGSITAIGTAFGLGRLHSSIAQAEENIWLSHRITCAGSDWDTTLQQDTKVKIYDIINAYYKAEVNRKNKLCNYQSSLLGIAFGTGVGVIGACCNQQLLALIGLITGVVSVTFGAYQMSIHWDDFTKAQYKFADLKLIDLISQPQPPAYQPRTQPPAYEPQPQPPTPAGWNIPRYT